MRRRRNPKPLGYSPKKMSPAGNYAGRAEIPGAPAVSSSAGDHRHHRTDARPDDDCHE